MKIAFMVLALTFVRLLATAQVKMSDYIPQNKILRFNGIFPTQNGIYTIDEYDTYDKKHKLISASYVEKNGISDYDKDLNLNFRIIFPKKINGTIAYYNNCLHVEGTYYLFVETLENEKGMLDVHLYCLTYNPESKEWSEPKRMLNRPGGWLVRRNSKVSVTYNSSVKKFRILTNIYEHTGPNQVTLFEFDTELKETAKKNMEGPVPESVLSRYHLTNEYEYFFYKDYSAYGSSPTFFGQTPKKRYSYWLITRNIINGTTTRFSFDTDLYDLNGGWFVVRDGRTLFYADLISTEESKNEYREKHDKIGWFAVDLSNIDKPTTNMIKASDFFDHTIEKNGSGIQSTLKPNTQNSVTIRWKNLVPAKDGYFVFIETITETLNKSGKKSSTSDFSYHIIVIKTDTKFNIVRAKAIPIKQKWRNQFYNRLSQCLVWEENEQLRLYYIGNEKNIRLPEDEKNQKAFNAYLLNNAVFREVIINENGSIGPERELLSIDEKEALAPWEGSPHGHFNGKLYFMVKQYGKDHRDAGKIKILEVTK